MFCVIYTSNITLVEHGKSTQFQTLCEDLETLQEHIKEQLLWYILQQGKSTQTLYDEHLEIFETLQHLQKNAKNCKKIVKNCQQISVEVSKLENAKT